MNNIKEYSSQGDAVRKLFTETFEDYASLFLPKKTGKNFIFRQRLVLAATLAAGKSGQILDCATGSGEITSAIIRGGKFEGATILDLSPKMLETASGRIKGSASGNSATKIELICDDVFHFAGENSDRKYDFIVCLGLIAHTGRLAELLKLLRGMLAVNGTIMLQSTLLDHFGTRVERRFSQERYFRKYGYRINYFRHQDIEAACADAGLKISGQTRFSLGLPFGDRLWPWGNYQMERIFQRWAAARGSEAVYLLKNHADA